MDNLTWLAGRVDVELLSGELTSAAVTDSCLRAADTQLHGAVVAPTHVAAVPEELSATAVVGYPTGRHHTLIKASEARLAVETGAVAVWLTLDPVIQDANTLLSEIIAVRQAVPAPVHLSVIATGTASIQAAEQAGADAVVVDKLGQSRNLAEILRADLDLDGAIDALGAGATRLAVTDPKAVLTAR